MLILHVSFSIFAYTVWLCLCACVYVCVMDVLCIYANTFDQLFDRVAAGTCHGFVVGNFFLKTIVLTHCTIIEGISIFIILFAHMISYSLSQLLT